MRATYAALIAWGALELASAPESVARADGAGQASGTPPAAHATIDFRNDVGRAFVLRDARFVLDGRDLPVVVSGAARGDSYSVFAGELPPGRHAVTVHATYRGRPRGGLFTYMAGYRLNVTSTAVLTVPAEGSSTFTLVDHERTGPNVPLDRRIEVGLEPAP